MRSSRKVKVSLALSAELLAQVDRAARREGASRSSLVEQWLRSGASRAAETRLEDSLVAYYTSRTQQQRDDDDAIAEASSRAARDLEYDAAAPRQPRRRARRRAAR